MTKVFVSLYVMLGDADDSFDGWKIMDEEKWKEEVNILENFLSENNMTSYEVVGGEGNHSGELSVSSYKAKVITEEEIAVVKKFFGNSSGFYLPGELIEEISSDDESDDEEEDEELEEDEEEE